MANIDFLGHALDDRHISSLVCGLGDPIDFYTEWERKLLLVNPDISQIFGTG